MSAAASFELPWLAEEMRQLTAAHRARRLPHALLIHDAAGAGGERLATFAASLALCQRFDAAPCGCCQGCTRVRQNQHPDLLWVRVEEDASQISIDQIRTLSAELALTSHGGGAKVAIVSPADAVNRNSANAFLKTLEEPPAGTLLVLVAQQPSRLPATILSRCQRIRVRAPTREQSLAWLASIDPKAAWPAVLDALGEAPLLAASLDPAALAELVRDTRAALEAAISGSLDPAATAERWAGKTARAEMPFRLQCFENWITERIRARFGVGVNLTELRGGAHLPGAGSDLNIRRLFGVLDGVRELRAAPDTPLNRPLVLENLLRSLRTEGTRRAAPAVAPRT